jgi:hypothetical protein
MASSEKVIESEKHSDYAHSISPPPTSSPDGRKRKRNNEKIPARPNTPNQLPRNLHRTIKRPSTPSA